MNAILLPLLAALAAANFADQLTLAALTLLAARMGVPAGEVSLLVAAQSAAWLLVSLPAGAFADRMPRRRLMTIGAVAVAAGGFGGALAISTGFSPWQLSLAAFAGSAGLVIISLSVLALAGSLIQRESLPAANARLEFGRAIGTLVAPPVAAAVLLAGSPLWPFLMAGVCGLTALVAIRMLPDAPPPPASVPIGRAIADGGRFVFRNRHLLSIALCAIFWNAAFFALIAIFASFAIGARGLDVQTTGLVWSAYGAGLIAAAWPAAFLIRRLRASTLMIFGPASSFAAVLLLVLAPATLVAPAAVIAFFLLGFGPMLWLIMQTTVRQIVTPAALIGRVSATISVAMYGVRPLGALAAGWIAATQGIEAALWLPVLLFGLSLLAILLSPFPRIHSLGELTPAAG